MTERIAEVSLCSGAGFVKVLLFTSEYVNPEIYTMGSRDNYNTRDYKIAVNLTESVSFKMFLYIPAI